MLVSHQAVCHEYVILKDLANIQQQVHRAKSVLTILKFLVYYCLLVFH